MTAGTRIYFDHNASSPLRPAAAEAMTGAYGLTGNPSSVHAEGRAARAAIERARRQVAAAVGARPADVVFTSGATEGLNALLRPGVRATTGPSRFERLLLLSTEHAAARDGHGFTHESVEKIPVTTSGVIDLEWLERRLRALRGDELFASAMVAVQAANNETGVLQPIAEVARLCDAAGAAPIVDAAQAAGKIGTDIGASGAAAIVLSAHKFGGPKGVGAIVFNGDRLRQERPFVAGGGQEGRRRAGTENVAAIVGMGQAIEDAEAQREGFAAQVATWRDEIEQGIRRIAPEAVIFGAGADRLPNVSLFAVPGLRAETLLMAFDLAGIALSSGAACSSGKVARSHVLDAMGVEAACADGAMRLSLGWTTTEDEVLRFVTTFENVVRSLCERKNLRAA